MHHPCRASYWEVFRLQTVTKNKVEHHPVGKEWSSVVSTVALRSLEACRGSDAIERYLNEEISLSFL